MARRFMTAIVEEVSFSDNSSASPETGDIAVRLIPTFKVVPRRGLGIVGTIDCHIPDVFLRNVVGDTLTIFGSRTKKCNDGVAYGELIAQITNQFMGKIVLMEHLGGRWEYSKSV